MKKRILSILLTLCMVLCFMPTAVFAEGEGNTDTDKAIQIGTSQIEGGQASCVYYGTYKQSSDGNGGYNTDPIKWRVLSNADGKLFLLADQNLDVLKYHTDFTGVSWEGSSLRSWLNNTFLEAAFSSKDRTAIADTHVLNKEHHGTSAGNDTTDKIFLLSIEEGSNTDYGFSSNASQTGESTGRVSLNTAYAKSKLTNQSSDDWPFDRSDAGDWWLRSPGSGGVHAADVSESGYLSWSGRNVNSDNTAVRPAFNLNLNVVLFTSDAEGGKSDTAVDENLSDVSENTGSGWKLTLKDSSRSFSADVNGQTSVSAPAGGSVQITYSGAQTGENEYVSVLLCDGNDNVLYYGNIAQSSASGTASVTIPAGLAPGSYTLKVFSEQCNGDCKTDYASAFQNITLNVYLPQEATPNSTFTAINDNSGTLSGVDTSMKYSVDGGTSWNDITGETMEIAGVTAEQDVKVYKPGNGTTTSDSEVQTIDITQAAQPTGINKADCTTSEQNNGQITGVDTTMEYKLSTDSVWKTITANPVTGLTDGTYEVRVKASGTVLASSPAAVTIGAHTCVAQGDWQYDATSHWKLCACGAKVEETAHSGGEATCTALAACEVCGQPYGAKNPSHHTGKASWITTETTHTKVYSCCQTVIEAETAHIWENGKCSVCQYDCEHQGGTATCSQLAQCEICESLYGNYDPNNHKAAEAWTQENGKHYHICEYGCDTHLDETNCSGGMATCTALAVCETCLQTYGLLNSNNHTDTTEWIQTATTHTQKCKCCGSVVVAEENHEWENGVCTECDYECVHQYNWQSENGMYWQHCTICGFDTNKKAIPTIPINGADKICRTQDYKFSFTLPEGATNAEYGYEFIGLGDGPLTPTVEDNLYSGILKATIYPAEETGFKLIVSAKTADGFEFSAEKMVTIQNEHTGGTATCTEQATCEVCGEKYGDLKLHNYSADWVTDETSHWHECTECGAKTDEDEHIDADKDHKCDLCGKTFSEHSGGTATCKDKAKCEVCGESYGDLDADNHTDLQHFPAVAATKTSEGNIEYWYCDGCGKYYKDAKATQEITKAQIVTAKLQDESKSPQTGDNSNLLVWIALLLASGGAVTATIVYGRKKKRSIK